MNDCRGAAARQLDRLGRHGRRPPCGTTTGARAAAGSRHLDPYVRHWSINQVVLSNDVPILS